MTLADMKRERNRLDKLIADWERRIVDERYDCAVKKLGITLDQVEDARTHDEWYGSVWNFDEWCDKNSTKPYRAWNDSVYSANRTFRDVVCDMDAVKRVALRDPVHQNPTDGKWWFWCEDWASAEGPFEDEGLARAALARYVQQLEDGRCQH